ncbi:unnamed protein product [Blumeria hordei]|uniref:Uncharacterized protein n=1 Tax=Blumeria hordei TaxID=2867405 RepID=A0A383UXD9_BLUHO|nr:unnamed protein product [Blumeria hordei]
MHFPAHSALHPSHNHHQAGPRSHTHSLKGSLFSFSLVNIEKIAATEHLRFDRCYVMS